MAARRRARPLLLGTTAGQIGYTSRASGMASLLKAILTLHHQELPGCPGLSEPASWLAEHVQHPRAPLQATRILPVGADRRLFAGVNCHNLSDLAYHIILERGEPVAPAPAAAKPVARGMPAAAAPAAAACRLVRFGGATLAEAWDKASQAGRDPQPWLAAADSRRFFPTDRGRLTIVARGPRGPGGEMPLGRCASGTFGVPRSAGDKGDSCRQGDGRRPRTALLFPGQGSQYPGMLRSLLSESEAARCAMRQCDDVLAAMGLPSFAEAAWEREEELGVDLERTQLARCWPPKCSCTRQ